MEGGKFSNYLQAKVSRGNLAPSIARLTIAVSRAMENCPLSVTRNCPSSDS